MMGAAMVGKSKESGVLVSKRWKVILVAIIVLVVSGTVMYIFFTRQHTPEVQNDTPLPSYSQLSHDLREDLTRKKTSAIIEDYSKYYETAMKDISHSEPKTWNNDMVNKAHMCLLYSDKMGLTTQALSLYQSISSARAQGVNVDDNSAGLTQEDRQQIYKRNGGMGL